LTRAARAAGTASESATMVVFSLPALNGNNTGSWFARSAPVVQPRGQFDQSQKFTAAAVGVIAPRLAGKNQHIWIDIIICIDPATQQLSECRNRRGKTKFRAGFSAACCLVREHDRILQQAAVLFVRQLVPQAQ